MEEAQKPKVEDKTTPSSNQKPELDVLKKLGLDEVWQTVLEKKFEI